MDNHPFCYDPNILEVITSIKLWLQSKKQTVLVSLWAYKLREVDTCGRRERNWMWSQKWLLKVRQ
jgi:hypothetical protein